MLDYIIMDENSVFMYSLMDNLFKTLSIMIQPHSWICTTNIIRNMKQSQIIIYHVYGNRCILL